MKAELIFIIILGVIGILGLLFFTGAEVTTAEIWDDSKPLQEINITKMEKLRWGLITVYFPPLYRSLAGEVGRALSQGWLLVKNHLGIELGDFALALVEGSEDQIGGVYIKQRGGFLHPPRPPFPVLVSPGIQNLEDAPLPLRAGVYWSMPHEATHRIIGLEFDPQARGFEEGLAEYVGYLVSKELDPEAWELALEKRQQQIKALVEKRDPPFYDLTKFRGHLRAFTVSQLLSPAEFSLEEIAGYGVSLAFWLQIVNKHGEAIIKKFLGQLSKSALPNARDAARILSELTGEDIWTKLQNMDLHEVLRTLEEAAGAS